MASRGSQTFIKVTQPPAAKTRNPSEAFQLYELASQRANGSTLSGSARHSPTASIDSKMPTKNLGTQVSDAFQYRASPSLFTPVSETPPYSDVAAQTASSSQTSAGSVTILGPQTWGWSQSARSSMALIPCFLSKLFASESKQPYKPNLVTFCGRTVIGDDGFKLANVAFAMFLMGWADASNGAQLPFIQEHFHLEYLEVATLFVANFFGWVLSAGINPYLTDHLGLGKTLIIGSLVQTASCIVLCSAPPFVVLDLGFVLIGLGIGIINASTTAWTANQSKPHLKLGFVLASYGLGALLAPIIVGLMSKAGIEWNSFYLVSLGLTVVNGALLLASFRLESEDSWTKRKEAHHHSQRRSEEKPSRKPTVDGSTCEEHRQSVVTLDDEMDALPQLGIIAARSFHGPSLSHRRPSNVRGTTDESWRKSSSSSRDATKHSNTVDDEEVRIESAPPTRPSSPDRDASSSSLQATSHELVFSTTGAKFKALGKMKVVWIFSIFAFANTGTEVSIGGWTSSYLREHGSGEEAEWIVSAFWAGLMVGRIILIPISHWIGEQRAIFLYLSSWLALEVVVWATPNLISKAVATSFSGLALGPCFPILAGLATKVIRPRALHTPALGLTGTAAQSGSAFFPFLVGLLAQAKGVKVLPPFVVACLALQIGIWILLGWPFKKPTFANQD